MNTRTFTFTQPKKFRFFEIPTPIALAVQELHGAGNRGGALCVVQMYLYHAEEIKNLYYNSRTDSSADIIAPIVSQVVNSIIETGPHSMTYIPYTSIDVVEAEESEISITLPQYIVDAIENMTATDNMKDAIGFLQAYSNDENTPIDPISKENATTVCERIEAYRAQHGTTNLGKLLRQKLNPPEQI